MFASKAEKACQEKKHSSLLGPFIIYKEIEVL
jgi:hypothetical protein